MKFVTVAILGILISSPMDASRGRHSSKTREHQNIYIGPTVEPVPLYVDDMNYMNYGDGLVIRNSEEDRLLYQGIIPGEYEYDSGEEILDPRAPVLTGIVESQHRMESIPKPQAFLDEALSIILLNYTKKTDMNK